MKLTVGKTDKDNERMIKMENKIQKLLDEVDIYKQAIQDAYNALDEAERELGEVLSPENEQENTPSLTVMKQKKQEER